MNNQVIDIPLSLRPYIRNAWALDSLDMLGNPTSFSIYADGCPGIIFCSSENDLHLNQSKKLSSVFLYGQTVQPITLDSERRLKMVVLSFHPHIIRPLFRFSAKEVTDDCLDLNLLPAVPRINLSQQLWNSVPAEKQVQVLFDYVRQVIDRNNGEIDKGIQYATDKLIDTNGSVSLKRLQNDLNVTERTFERRFEQFVGVSPKMFSKISQFQASLAQIKSNKFLKLSDVAYDNGYADQSHFIRTFRKFTGRSPLDFYRQLPDDSPRHPLANGAPLYK
jgi:AraC-like DNA-binding protein